MSFPSSQNNLKDFWNEKYQTQKTGWDLGTISIPLKTYFDQITNKELEILIPGCGNAWEAEYLFNNGFINTHIIDLSELAIKNFSERVPRFPKSQTFTQNFFDHNKKYDLIIEQTFFCAINPIQRLEYAKKMSDLLNPGGKLVGLLFNIDLNTDHPPFGGSITEYQSIFSPYFHIRKLESAHNSIQPRSGSEVFIQFEKK